MSGYKYIISILLLIIFMIYIILNKNKLSRLTTKTQQCEIINLAKYMPEYYRAINVIDSIKRYDSCKNE